MESAEGLWPERSESLEQEAVVARACGERYSYETGLPMAPVIARLIEEGIRALSWALFEQPTSSGPLPGTGASKPRLAQLRERNVRSPSGRHTNALTEVLQEWDVTESLEEARWLTQLLMGRDKWDGDHFGSSAIWAGALKGTAGGAMPATDQAATEWAVLVDRLLAVDGSTRRDAIVALVLQLRRERDAVLGTPAPN